MKWASAVSDSPVFEKALRECEEKLAKELSGPPDLAVLFLSPHHARHYPQIWPHLSRTLKPSVLLGCSGGGVIGDGHEVEQKAGLSLTAGILPEVEITPFHITNEALPDPDASPRAWQELMQVSPDKEPQFVVLADPFSFDAERYMAGMDYAFPKSTKVGGMASGARQPGENVLFLNGACHREGLAGVSLSGNILLESVVAQGCRPVGQPLMVTACHENVLLELDKRPPMKVLEELYDSLAPRDQQLFRTSLFLGIVMDSSRSSYSFGDFLIRNIIGVDAENGVIATSAELREGQIVQFHLRDAQTSAEDLTHILSRYSRQKEKEKPSGALLFSCLGRGLYLYGEPDHDTKAFEKIVAKVPIGGFFCNGELGPVHNTTYLHGYTSCFGIFRNKEAAVR